MKKFKDLANNIGLYESGEHTAGGGVQFPSATPREISAISDEGVHNIQLKSQLNRINAFLSAFSRKEYMDVRGALGMLRAKLNIAGLDFDFKPNAAEQVNQEGTHMFPINRFGGTFGKTLDTPFDEFETTDGIAEYNNGKGFNLVVDVEVTSNGAYKIGTRLEETGSDKSETEEEKLGTDDQQVSQFEMDSDDAQ